ncbi:hypothetical protein Nmel_011288 [Mimus melanotis]
MAALQKKGATKHRDNFESICYQTLLGMLGLSGLTVLVSMTPLSNVLPTLRHLSWNTALLQKPPHKLRVLTELTELLCYMECVLFALNQTLLQHESLRAGSLQAPYTTEDLIKHYNCGDLNAVIFNHDTSQLLVQLSRALIRTEAGTVNTVEIPHRMEQKIRNEVVRINTFVNMEAREFSSIQCSSGELQKVPNFINTTLPPHEQVTAQEIDSYFRQELIYKRNEGAQVPNFINTTLPPHEQVTAQEIDSYFRQELIYKRNERMGRRVMSLLRENRDKSFFFAFGAVEFTFLCDKSINNNHPDPSSAES